ncbi:MAG: hypothetical protein DRJ65_15700, partial [Acidobacteria bacterium]
MRRFSGALALVPVLIILGCGGRDSGQEPAWFSDVSKEAGISFVHDARRSDDFLFPEINGAGAAFLDYNRDGWLDIYLVQSGSDLRQPEIAGAANALYRNRGDGTFEDVTEAAVAGATGFGQGVACGDYDNDGWTDIYITNVGANVLLRNQGDGTFADVTEIAGVGYPGWSIPAAFIDIDRDGLLDLYVGNYVMWSPEQERRCRIADTGRQDYCGPRTYRPEGDVLYRNRGDGTFDDITISAGLDAATGPAMSTVCADLDDDGWIDIYVANDGSPNQLWINRGNGTFEDRSLTMGCAVTGNGSAYGSMGTNAVDLDQDGDLDLFMAHFDRQSNTIYLMTNGFFEDASARADLVRLTSRTNGFGAAFLDIDHSGELWLYLANGRGNMAVTDVLDADPYGETDQLLAYRRDEGRFEDHSDRLGATREPPLTGRGLAVGDFDNDGDPDLLINHNNGPARLLRNDAGNRSGRHWIQIRCLGADDSSDAIGARVEISVAGRRYRRDLILSHSYASSSDPRLHFGLGENTLVDEVVVHWPDGSIESWHTVAADQVFTAVRGS